MKIKFLPLLAIIITSTILAYGQSSPTLAQSKLSRFYCGSTNQKEPATMLVTKDRIEEKTFVVWKNDLNGVKAKERCRNASKIFQKAWSRGNLKYFVGEKGSICVASSKDSSCLENILFLDSKKKAQETAIKLDLIMQEKPESPIYQ
jgi:Circadian oscillating protein COP23